VPKSQASLHFGRRARPPRTIHRAARDLLSRASLNRSCLASWWSARKMFRPKVAIRIDDPIFHSESRFKRTKIAIAIAARLILTRPHAG
jgi:hypothetical protein